MSARKDPRFHDWKPNKMNCKGELLLHLDYAHERQSLRDYCKWMANYNYFLKKYTKAELLKIHEKYHAEKRYLETGY